MRAVDVVPDAFDRAALSVESCSTRIASGTARVPSPFWRRYAWHVRQPLDLDAMVERRRTR